MFADRMSVGRYENDPPWGVAIVASGGSANWDATGMVTWIPERLLARLAALGTAYELPLVMRLSTGTSIRFGREHCQTLPDELHFISETINDPLMRTHIVALESLANKVARDHLPRELLIEGS